MLPVIQFEPRFKERVWGGRNLERLYTKQLPPTVPVGESWEIADRPGDVSEIRHGPLAGRSLRWVMENHERDLLGDARPWQGRFPLLIKILDAQQDLSLQVHPPASCAAALKGEPKAEMWFVTDARSHASIYVGLRNGVARAEFERRIQDGTVADCFHRHVVSPGDAMVLPSGRAHAIGAGIVLFEIQQNSDTTYRVFDWNRRGLDGNLRELHIEQSLVSIDFADIEPGLVPEAWHARGAARVRPLAQCPQFNVEQFELAAGRTATLSRHTMHIIGVVSGDIIVKSDGQPVRLLPGQFCLAPACTGVQVEAGADASFLRAEAGC